MAEFKETVIDHISGDGWCGVSTGEEAMRNKLLRLAEKYPDEIQVVAKNEDGSAYFHVPWKWIKIRHPQTYTPEQIEQMTKTLADARAFPKRK